VHYGEHEWREAIAIARRQVVPQAHEWLQLELTASSRHRHRTFGLSSRRSYWAEIAARLVKCFSEMRDFETRARNDNIDCTVSIRIRFTTAHPT
jgi:hypothetical protein